MREIMVSGTAEHIAKGKPMSSEIYTGPDAYETAKRKARYGTRSWIISGRAGSQWAAVVTYDTIKRAMLENGTGGHFVVYHARSRWGNLLTWSCALIYLRKLKSGYYTH